MMCNYLYNRIFYLSRFSLLIILFIGGIATNAQSVYKTPSGKKYHYIGCRYVKKSKAIQVDSESIARLGLGACKVCSPRIGSSRSETSNFIKTFTSKSTPSNQCLGKTQKGARCKRITNSVSGYCFLHSDLSTQKHSFKSYSRSTSKSFTSTCGARTKSGGFCKRRVKGGGRCYQH